MKIFFTTLLLFRFLMPVEAQQWEVPADRKGRLSPFKFDDQTRKEGERLYMMNCKSCHGNPGKGDFQATLVPKPADPVSETIQKNLDGELFYKISLGRGPMPGFRTSLSTNDMWNVISFLRSFRKDYIQAIAPVIKSSAYPGAEIAVSLLTGKTSGEIVLNAKAVSEKATVPVTGAGVRLYVKRTFGRMEIDEEKTTDSNGQALFMVPSDLPGDTAGNLHISAVFTDEEAFGSVSKDTILKAGQKIMPVSLTAQRAMWNVVRKAPLWIMLTYTLGVLGVWGFIFIIMFKLRDIYIIGDHVAKTQKQ